MKLSELKLYDFQFLFACALLMLCAYNGSILVGVLSLFNLILACTGKIEDTIRSNK